MRTEQVLVSFKFPAKAGEPDKNGNIYTEDAISKACEDACWLPIVQLDELGEGVPVGVANKVWYENGYINVDGIAWHGGTCENVKLDDLGRISDMTITSFSICK